MFTLDLPSSRLHRGIAFAVLLACGVAGSAFAQIDPGVRGGPADAGGPLPGLAGGDLILFDAAAIRFNEVDSVSGTIDDRTNTATQITGAGLGPGFNGNDCALCHAQPAVGGSSPFTNPQIRISTLDGAKNTVPAFITTNGPTREARFINNPNGTPDGGVHDLFVITGRTDATQDGTTCTAAQPNFPQALAANNVIFRIPTPVFGLGLVENTPDVNLTNDSALVANLQEMEGISSGDFNHSGNDGTITRFGWKAQNKSLLMFAGEAYNVEQGVTNDLFPNERIDLGDCMFNTLPEDTVNEIAFLDVGCGLCHIPFHVTGNSDYSNQSFVTYFPFSDIALHDMGTKLEDQISQGGADGFQFRSAPLWGVGQRVFFLHDGRTSNLLTAIEDHKSKGSEANIVIDNFNLAGPIVEQQILDFLRSL